MKTTLSLFFAGILMILGIGCSTSPQYDRGSLSDAMEKSRDDYPDEREVPSDEKPWWEQEDPEEENRNSGGDSYDDEESNDESNYDPGPSEPLFFGVRGGNALTGGPYFDSLFDGEFLLGFEDGNVMGAVFAGLKAVKAKPDSEISESIEEGVLILRAGVEGRYYPLPDLKYFSPYLLGQAGGLYMYWSFKNPLDAGVETIAGDSVGGVILGAGAGVDLLHLENFKLGASCIPEAHLFGAQTQEGFDNDVFGAYGTVRWTVEALVKM